MKKFKQNSKIMIFFILGLVLAGSGVYAATTIAGSNITYSNSKSGLSSTNVQNAIDELYEKSDIRKVGRFVNSYTYNQTSGASNYCVTGEESTCKRTTCYKNKIENSCPSGTIIKYKVNDTDIINFHVMFDEKNTITMLSQKNIVYNVDWSNKIDYNGVGGECYIGANNYPCNDKGPISILPILENVTRGWSNVNDQTYTLGTTSLSGKGASTGCNIDNYECTSNTYTLPERTAKARMLTAQEAKALGCTNQSKSCPIWVYNYLKLSTNYGGANDDIAANDSYWLINGNSSGKYGGITINEHGNFSATANHLHGTRAVVVIAK